MGLVAALVPLSFPTKVLLSSAVLGAGITGLMSEFAFCVDRRDAKFKEQIQRQREASLQSHVGSLEHQVRQVDSLAKKTKLVAINQLFKLGQYLEMVRFNGEDELETFRGQADELAEILGLTNAVRKFLSSPYLRQPEPPPEGQDPGIDLMRAMQLRYSHDGIEAFKAGSAVGGLIISPEAPVDESFREVTASMLKKAMPKLYLLPAVHDNIMSAIQELLDNAYQPRWFARYMTLFGYYLTYRMNGRYSNVAHLFQSRVSLTQLSTTAEIRRALNQIAGEQVVMPEPVVAAETSDTYEANPVSGQLTGQQPEDEEQPRQEYWFRFLRGWALLFWPIAAATGLVAALAPVAFPAKVLLCSAVVGAGIAGLISEFTSCSDRSKAKVKEQIQEEREARLKHQVASLEHQVGQVDDLMEKTEIVAITQLFYLGMNLYMIHFGSQHMGMADELAEILGLTDAVRNFLSSSNPRQSAQDPIIDLRRAVELRYAQEGLEAYKCGFAIGSLYSTPETMYSQDHIDQIVSILKNAMPMLYLRPVVCKNMLNAIQELEDNACEFLWFTQYVSLFVYYLEYRMNGTYPDVAPLFESRVSLAQPSSIAKIIRILALLAGNPTEASGPGDRS